MAKVTSNLEYRRGGFYYRSSFTLNRKRFSIRLTLNTADLATARERVARMDRLLRRQWREVTRSMISADEQQSIMRAAAVQARDNLAVIAADFLRGGYDAPDDGAYDHRRSLTALEIVVRDLHLNGLTRDFGSREYEMHLLDGWSPLDREGLARLREVIEGGAGLADGFREQADEALRVRNIDATPTNRALAARQITVGTLLSLREAMKTASDPAAALDALLASLEEAGAAVVPALPQVPATPPAVSATIPLALPAVVQSAAAGVTAGAPAMTGIAGMTIKAAAAAFLAAHPRYDDDSVLSVWTPKTRSQFEAAIFLAYKFFGDTAVGAVDEVALADFVRILRKLPQNHHKTPTHAALTLADIATRGVGATLSAVTTNRHIRFLRLVLDWAWKRVPVPPVVEWAAFIEADRRLKRDKRPAFTAAELQTLFGGAVWQGWESVVRRMKPGPHVRWDAPYWIPILLAYTGARREEIAKLEVADVEEIDGIWALRLRVTEAGRLKNASSERDVPVADEVMRLGFLDFVTRQRDAGQTLLFPELDRTAGTMGDVFYKRWWRGMERAGLVPVDKDIHSIRHYVSTALAEVEVSEERRADLLGHTLQSETAGTYTERTSLRALKAVVNLIPIVTADVTRPPATRLI